HFIKASPVLTLSSSPGEALNYSRKSQTLLVPQQSWGISHRIKICKSAASLLAHFSEDRPPEVLVCDQSDKISSLLF
ncbi:hypothetical protein, partial [Pseudodesulfovibrio alkaliphilus]|uniref:hypothetical protein n=1 Tax=Pseudodesulfovibrio alkaliphilus TaxID=2661613 RepID=UPI001E3018F1